MSRNLQSMDDSSSDDALEIIEDEDDDITEIASPDVVSIDHKKTQEKSSMDASDRPKISIKPTITLLAKPPLSQRNVPPTKHPFKYKCPFCFKFYTSRSGLTSHKNSVHLRAKPYRCETCNEHFSSSAQRVAHIHKAHGGLVRAERQQQIAKDNSTNTRGAINGDKLILVMPMNSRELAQHEHQQQRVQQRLNTKSSNQIYIIQPNKQQQHQKSNTMVASVQQPLSIQPQEKLDPRSHNNHIHLRSSLPPLSSESFECDECQIHFEFFEDLVQHLSHHTLLVEDDIDDALTSEAGLKQPISCCICTFVPEAPPGSDHAEQERRLRHHIMSKHFQASFPGLEPPTRGSYRSIEVNEPKEKNENAGGGFAIRCSFCPKSYERESHLQIHLRYHHPDSSAKPNPLPTSASTNTPVTRPSTTSRTCSRCSQVFPDEAKLREHATKLCPRLGHTCIKCSHKFETNDQLSEHIKREHGINVEAVPPGNYEFNCSYCHKVFSSESLVRSHRNICRQNNPFSCPICKKCFPNSFDMLRHIGVDHVSPNHVLTCNKCSFATESVNEFTSHYRTHLVVK